jgi:hypothetical protein
VIPLDASEQETLRSTETFHQASTQAVVTSRSAAKMFTEVARSATVPAVRRAR